MKRIFFFTIFVCLLSHISAQDKEYSINDVPNMRLTNTAFHVSDPDNILERSTIDSVNSMLTSLEKDKGIQSAIVVLPSIGNAEINDFALQLGRKWGVGDKKKNNGLVILLVIDQRKVHFATGYGLEGDLPDAVCKRIQTRAMVPSFKHNNWDDGLLEGTKAVCGILDGTMKAEYSSDDSASDEDDDYAAYSILFVFILTIGGGIFIAMAVHKSSKCPHCGKHGLVRTSSKVLSCHKGVQIEMVNYTCKYCGQKLNRKQNSYVGGAAAGGAAGGFFGGSGGSGGGYSGGSFGGGSFGGGGSSSSF